MSGRMCLQVFFIRDGAEFVDLAHALKASPVNGLSVPWRTADFLSFHPESMHMVCNHPFLMQKLFSLKGHMYFSMICSSCAYCCAGFKRKVASELQHAAAPH